MLNPSVAIDPEVDDHPTEGETCAEWMRSPEGQQAKRENPRGYLNVRLHFLLHRRAGQQKQQEQAGQLIQQAGALEVAKSKAKALGETMSAPIKARAKVQEEWGKQAAKATLNPPAPVIVNPRAQ